MLQTKLSFLQRQKCCIYNKNARILTRIGVTLAICDERHCTITVVAFVRPPHRYLQSSYKTKRILRKTGMQFVNDSCHKAVVVLDKGPKFAQFAEIELKVSYKDANSKLKTAGFSPKTFWNCSIDSAVEFQRVLTDVYPNGTHVARYLVVEATKQYVFNNWHPVALDEDEFIQAFYELGCTPANPELDQSSCSIMNGVEAAIDALTEPSPHQKRYLETLDVIQEFTNHNLIDGVQRSRSHRDVEPSSSQKSRPLKNECTMFIITSFDDAEKDMQQLTDSTQQYFDSKNRLIEEMEANENVLLIERLKVYVLNITESNPDTQTTVTNNPSPDVSFIMYNVTPKTLNSYLHRAMLEAYNLASTTITGIPMKEETQPTKSFDYDVEIFHPRVLHDQLFSNKVLENSKVTKQLECGYETIQLKWCNPVQKLRKDAFPIRDSSTYCTPVDILSRPTMCVIGFLKKGKQIWLEIPEYNEEELSPNIAGRLVTHVLSFDVQRGGMTMAAMSFGEEFAVYEYQLSQAIERTNITDYDKCDSVMLLMTNEFLEKLDAATSIDIVRREERIYVDDDDPYFKAFACEQKDEDEPEIFVTHNHVVEEMKPWYNDVISRFEFNFDAKFSAGSKELFAVINTIEGPLKPCDDAVRTLVNYITQHLLADEEVFRANFPRNFCIMYDLLLLLQKKQPGLFYQYVDKVRTIFTQYAERYKISEIFRPPKRKINSVLENVNKDAEPTPKWACTYSDKIVLYPHLDLNAPIPSTKTKESKLDEDEIEDGEAID